jgi:hypothetical protein
MKPAPTARNSALFDIAAPVTAGCVGIVTLEPPLVGVIVEELVVVDPERAAAQIAIAAEPVSARRIRNRLVRSKLHCKYVRV